MPGELPAKRPSETCDIYRNGRLYDRLNPDTHEVLQIHRSYALDMPGDTWDCYKKDGSLWASFRPTVGATQS